MIFTVSKLLHDVANLSDAIKHVDPSYFPPLNRDQARGAVEDLAASVHAEVAQ